MSTLRANTLSNVAGTKTVATDTVVDGSAKAWVNFNGTGTVAIRAAFNVSSITDHGTGDYSANFTTALPDANYAAQITTVIIAGTGYPVPGLTAAGGSQTTTACRFSTGFQNGATTVTADPATVCVTINR